MYCSCDLQGNETMKEKACGGILTIRREPLSVYQMKYSRKVKVYQNEHYKTVKEYYMKVYRREYHKKF